MEDNLTLVVTMIGDLKNDLCDFKLMNDTQHKQIITRQDYTNGKIGELKRSQLVLRGVMIGAGIVLLTLGFMPDRLYDLLRSAL